MINAVALPAKGPVPWRQRGGGGDCDVGGGGLCVNRCRSGTVTVPDEIIPPGFRHHKSTRQFTTIGNRQQQENNCQI